MSEEDMRPTGSGEPTELQVPGRALSVSPETGENGTSTATPNGTLPKGVTVLANGTLRGPGGRFLPGVVPTNALTSERAREIQLKRWEKTERAARDAMVKKAQEGGLNSTHTAPQAFGEAVGEVYAGALANAVDRPYDASRALKFVGQAAGLLRPPAVAGPTVAGNVYMLTLTPELGASWRAAGLIDVIDVDVVDADGTAGGTAGE